MANQNVVDPRQSVCLSYYINPKSETFGNMLRSALKAGYNESYARTLTVADPEWLSSNVKADVDRVKRAERNLDQMLNVEINLKNKIGVDVAKLQADVSKFILKTLARQKYSEEKEQFEPNVQINVVNYNQTSSDNVKPIKEVESL
jgi:primosomal protein N'